MNCLQDLFDQHNTSAYYNSFMPLYCSICNSPYRTYKHPPTTYEGGFPVLQFPDSSFMYGRAYNRAPYNPTTMQPEGILRRYYMEPSGTYLIYEREYHQGKENGPHRRYYIPEEHPHLPHGPMECEETYKDGLLHGISTTYWYNSGRKHEQRTYRYGLQHGIQQRWTREGIPETPIIYLWGHESSLCTWIYCLSIRVKKWWNNTHQTPEYNRLSD